MRYSNYPPGVTGNEPYFTGEEDYEEDDIEEDGPEVGTGEIFPKDADEAAQPDPQPMRGILLDH